jgi:phosphotriesterase-related protein
MNSLRPLISVLGPLAAEGAGVTDAHQHVWIETSVTSAGGAPAGGAPVLNDRALAEAGLAAYRTAGGGALLDCQPGGCGRNAVVLAQLSRRSGVTLIASTGFHLRRYYLDGYWLW